MAGVKIELDDTQKILLKRHLQKNGGAQVLFTKECAKAMNNYIPFKTGRLKDMMITINTNNVIYSAPYATKQYYTNKGMGRGGMSQGGLRCKMWDRRMFIDKGDNIVKTIAEFVGGKSK